MFPQLRTCNQHCIIYVNRTFSLHMKILFFKDCGDLELNLLSFSEFQNTKCVLLRITPSTKVLNCQNLNQYRFSSTPLSHLSFTADRQKTRIRQLWSQDLFSNESLMTWKQIRFFMKNVSRKLLIVQSILNQREGQKIMAWKTEIHKDFDHMSKWDIYQLKGGMIFFLTV